MKRLLFLPLFIFISIISSGFIFKGQIKGVVCGDKNFFQTLKKEFVQKNLYKQVIDINTIQGRLRIFDFKTGKAYEYSNFTESLIPVQDFFDIDIDSNLNRIETRFKLEGIRKDNIITLKFLAFQDGKLKKDYIYQEIFDIKNMTLKSEFEGIKVLDMQCEYIPIPKNIKIENK